jgi:hypothetical protein
MERRLVWHGDDHANAGLIIPRHLICHDIYNVQKNTAKREDMRQTNHSSYHSREWIRGSSGAPNHESR